MRVSHKCPARVSSCKNNRDGAKTSTISILAHLFSTLSRQWPAPHSPFSVHLLSHRILIRPMNVGLWPKVSWVDKFPRAARPIDGLNVPLSWQALLLVQVHWPVHHWTVNDIADTMLGLDSAQQKAACHCPGSLCPKPPLKAS